MSGQGPLLNKSAATGFVTVAPSNTQDSAHYLGTYFDAAGSAREGSRPMVGLYVGGAGTVQAVDKNGNSVQFTALAGAVLPIGVNYILLTGTSATLLVALYA